MIKFTCSDCGFALEAEEAEAGKLIRCRSCEALIAVPQPAEGSADPATTAALAQLSEAAKLERSVTAMRGMAVLVGGGALLLTGVAIFCSVMGTAATHDSDAPQPPTSPAVFRRLVPQKTVAVPPAPTTAPTASTDPGR